MYPSSTDLSNRGGYRFYDDDRQGYDGDRSRDFQRFRSFSSDCRPSRDQQFGGSRNRSRSGPNFFDFIVVGGLTRLIPVFLRLSTLLKSKTLK